MGPNDHKATLMPGPYTQKMLINVLLVEMAFDYYIIRSSAGVVRKKINQQSGGLKKQ
jgi:hypothetical protein